MKCLGTTVRTFAVLAAVSGAVLLTGCASLQDNLAGSQKEHVVPGKQIAMTQNFRPHRFCEIGLITSTSEANAVANIFPGCRRADLPVDRRSAKQAAL